MARRGANNFLILSIITILVIRSFMMDLQEV